MRKLLKQLKLGAWIVFFLALKVSAQDGGLSSNKWVKLSIPFRNSEGVLIAQVTSESVRMRPDQKMEVENFVAEVFRNSQVEWTLSTPRCILNQESREAVGESDVKIVNKEMEITGVGFHWLNNIPRFIIRNTVQVIILNGLVKDQTPGTLGKNSSGGTSKSPTTIWSDSLSFDYDKRVEKQVERIATFEGHVMAVDPQLTVKSQAMDVYFSKNNEVLRVVARNDVRMYHENKIALSERAVFTKESGTVVLSGARPRLQDEKGNWIVSRDDSIIYNVHTRHLEVNKPSLEIQPQTSIQTDPLKPLETGNLFASNPSPKISDSSRTKPFTKIDSDLLSFDYDKHTATFEGNVVAIDPQMTLKCNLMKVFFTDKGNEVMRVEAYQDVHMFHEGKEAVGDKAVFTKETGMIVLSGEKPKLKDEKGNWVVSKGTGIVYNTQTKQMRVDKPTMEVQASTGAELVSPLAPK